MATLEGDIFGTSLGPIFGGWVYSINLYTGITMSMSLALSICVFFISLMHLVNGVQFLNVIFFLLFAAAPAAAVFGTVTVALTII